MKRGTLKPAPMQMAGLTGRVRHVRHEHGNRRAA